ncbi:MAG: hydantoinase/oxoprolinase family protein, partial [Pirellulaceae bacterium]|nr:hydantoinase/oxoprolinase family protein [Pirellulaceae bacterium]
QPLGISLEEAAWGIHQIANENMANAARVHALERGKDPRRFPMFAFGGAGPVHAYRIAASLGSPHLVVPLGAGVMSTVGFLTAPLSFDFVRSWPVSLELVDWDQANRLISQMEKEGTSLLANSGVATEEMVHHRHVDMRFIGQGHEISVALPKGTLGSNSTEELSQEFQRVYAQIYERAGPPVPIEIINWRVVSSGPNPQVQLRTQNAAESTGEPLKGNREIWMPERHNFQSVPIYDRYRMQPGFRFSGPAVIEERESTVIISGTSDCHIDEQYNLRIQLEAPHAP